MFHATPHEVSTIIFFTIDNWPELLKCDTPGPRSRIRHWCHFDNDHSCKFHSGLASALLQNYVINTYTVEYVA